MKKLLLILLCLLLVYSCQFEEVKAYEEEAVGIKAQGQIEDAIIVDIPERTDVEQIKIETH